MRPFAYLWIALGGGIGSALRFWCSDLVARRFGDDFPWGTLLVNVTGSLAIGIFAGLTVPEGPLAAAPAARQFFMVGVCGGYTTFSALSLQTLALARQGAWLSAGANIGLSIVLCLVAVWLGEVIATAIHKSVHS